MIVASDDPRLNDQSGNAAQSPFVIVASAAGIKAIPSVVNAVVITNSNFNGIETGKAFEITWSDAVGPVSLTLKDGPSDNLKTVSELTCKFTKMS